jgi:hypothetical protein
LLGVGLGVIGFFNMLIWTTSPAFIRHVCHRSTALQRDHSRLRALPTSHDSDGNGQGTDGDGGVRSSLQAVHGSDASVSVSVSVAAPSYHGTMHHSDSIQYSGRPSHGGHGHGQHHNNNGNGYNERLLPYAPSSDRLDNALSTLHPHGRASIDDSLED